MFGYKYLGPWWSDGKFQPSVPYGKSRPKNNLDDAARTHDTRYAMYKGNNEALDAADDEFFERVNQIGGLLPTVSAYAVKYGNRFIRGGRQAILRGSTRKHPNDITSYQKQFQKDDQDQMAAVLAGLFGTVATNIIKANDKLPKKNLRGFGDLNVPKLNEQVVPTTIVDRMPTIPNMSPMDSLVHDADGGTAVSTPSGTCQYVDCYDNGIKTSSPIDMVYTGSGGMMPTNYAKNGRFQTGFKHSDTNVKDTWSLNIGGHNVRLTRKEYEKQVFNQNERNKVSRKGRRNKVYVGL